MTLAMLADMDNRDPRKWQGAEQFANTVGATFLTGHQVVLDRSQNEIELRGRWHDYPARLKFGLSFFDIEWEMQAQNPTGFELYLKWDLDAVPSVGQFSGQTSEDWGDGGNKVKTFFAKGYYLEASGANIDWALAAYQLLPEQIRTALATYMVADRIHHLYAY